MNRKGAIDKRLLIRHWFYIGILALVWVQILMFPNGPEYRIPSVLLGIGASMYTSFKMVQPLRWHESIVSNVILFSLDLSVCAALVMFSGGIHSPFILYTLAPVVTAAILLARIYTFVITFLTFSYVLTAFFIFSTTGVPDTLAEFNDFAIYLLTLSLAAVLPYFMNMKDRQNIKVKAVLSERQQLAREIHDNLCQTIYGLRWQIQMLRNGMVPIDQTQVDDKIDNLVEEAETDARNLISSLRSFKSGCSLVSELRACLSKCQREHGIKYELNLHGQEQNVDDLVKSEVLYICQEALRNATKHSRCQHIVLDLSVSNNYLEVTMSDDGCGFDKTKYAEGRGLMVMKERAESVGGRLEMKSTFGSGTEIKLEVPRRCPSELVLVSQ
ncbi:MAG: ATP-binding protein [Dehalococcoidales bacterium]|nr:ATP-binding protein [Dehalococcoidales bacterium]